MSADLQAVMERLTELWNTGDAALVSEVYSEGVERSDPNQKLGRGTQEIARYIAELRSGFPDFKLEMKRQTGDGDQVAMEWTATGTHAGTYLGIPATGRKVTMHGVTLDRIENGKVVNERAYFDRLSLLEQLGVAPGAAEAGAKSAAR